MLWACTLVKGSKTRTNTCVKNQSNAFHKGTTARNRKSSTCNGLMMITSTKIPTPPLYVFTYTVRIEVELSDSVTTTPTKTMSIEHRMRLPRIVRTTTTVSCRGVLNSVSICANKLEITMLSACLRTMDRLDAKNTKSILFIMRSYTSMHCKQTQNNSNSIACACDKRVLYKSSNLYEFTTTASRSVCA